MIFTATCPDTPEKEGWKHGTPRNTIRPLYSLTGTIDWSNRQDHITIGFFTLTGPRINKKRALIRIVEKLSAFSLRFVPELWRDK